MKKPVLAALGLAGACVACCTLPLAIPLLGGAAALGLTSWLGTALQVGREWLMLVLIASVTAVIWGAMVWTRRRRAKACGDVPSGGSACSVDPGCGCAPKTGSVA